MINILGSKLSDPTAALTSLATKLSFCMLFLASSILFYQMARKGSTIPPKYAYSVSVALILLGSAASIFATYEYSYTIGKMDEYCIQKNNICLYDNNMLNNAKWFYYVLCISFIAVNLYITYLLKKFP